jgi:hypothetical protein
MGDFAVHADRLSLAGFPAQLGADGVEFVIDFRGGPFVLAEPVIIIRVNDGVFALRQRYAPEGVAVANPPIEKYQLSDEPFQPIRNINNDFDCPLPREMQISNVQTNKFVMFWPGGKKQPSIIGAICVFVSKKGLDFRFTILVTRC